MWLIICKLKIYLRTQIIVGKYLRVFCKKGIHSKINQDLYSLTKPLIRFILLSTLTFHSEFNQFQLELFKEFFRFLWLVACTYFLVCNFITLLYIFFLFLFYSVLFSQNLNSNYILFLKEIFKKYHPKNIFWYSYYTLNHLAFSVINYMQTENIVN